MDQLRTDGMRRRRTFVARPVGDDAAELELQAILAAAAFFGPDTKLEVGGDYSVFESRSSRHKYAAAVPVHELVPEDA